MGENSKFPLHSQTLRRSSKILFIRFCNFGLITRDPTFVEVKTALINKDQKKALELEVKKLEVLLAMVREPDVNPTVIVKEGEEET